MFTTTTWRAPDPDNPTLMLHLADGLWIDLEKATAELANLMLRRRPRPA